MNAWKLVKFCSAASGGPGPSRCWRLRRSSSAPAPGCLLRPRDRIGDGENVARRYCGERDRSDRVPEVRGHEHGQLRPEHLHGGSAGGNRSAVAQACVHEVVLTGHGRVAARHRAFGAASFAERGLGVSPVPR